MRANPAQARFHRLDPPGRRGAVNPGYNRPPLSKELLRGEAPVELTWAEQPEWYPRHHVELALGVAVTELDAAAARARLADGTLVRFGQCLIATGAAPRVPPVPGAEHAFLLRTVVDSQAIHDRAVTGGRAVVIGGGFIGVEVAASLAAVGMRVTVLEMAPALWGGAFGSALGLGEQRARRAGVFRCGLEPRSPASSAMRHSRVTSAWMPTC